MRSWAALVAIVALGGCGAESRPAPEAVAAATSPTATATPGTKLVTGPSPYGRMLFDARGQAIYVFERDRPDRSVCFGACARAWPPVYAHGHPRAGAGVRRALLGTIERRGGRRQVTYAGRPLYFYVNEGPGQVLCHRVDLNGGRWWVVAPSGSPRP